MNITKEDILRGYFERYFEKRKIFLLRWRLMQITPRNLNELKINPFSGNGDVNYIDIRNFCKSGNSNIFSSTKLSVRLCDIIAQVASSTACNSRM